MKATIVDAWKRYSMGEDGRGPRRLSTFTLSSEDVAKWDKDPYRGLYSVQRCKAFLCENGDVFLSESETPVKNLQQEAVRERALAKLTPEEIDALGIELVKPV